MKGYLLVFFGAGCGGAIRHWVNALAGRYLGVEFPYGTLMVNIIGSLAMGMLIDYCALRGNCSQQFRLFLATGVLGGFTTFSAYTLDVAVLWQRNQSFLAVGYAIGSAVLALTALFAGMWLMRQLAA